MNQSTQSSDRPSTKDPIGMRFARFAQTVAAMSGHPAAFLLAFAVVVIWIVTGPLFDYSDTWQLVINTGTTIVTFLMVFLVQNSQNRDAGAMQAKLDELLRSVAKAREEFIGIEHLTDDEIEQIRKELEKRDKAQKKPPAKRTVGRLLDRR